MNIELIKEITYQDKKTLSERALKLSEETGEVSEAVLSYTNACGCSYKHKTRKDILEECTDVIIISLSLICAISEEENLKEMFETKIKKWNEKTKNIK